MKSFFPIKTDRNGYALVVVLFVITVISAMGYALTDMLDIKQDSALFKVYGEKSFYISEAGIEYGGMVLLKLSDWSTTSNTTKSLGGGSFTIVFSDYVSGVTESIKATSTGTFEKGTKVIEKTFVR